MAPLGFTALALVNFAGLDAAARPAVKALPFLSGTGAGDRSLAVVALAAAALASLAVAASTCADGCCARRGGGGASSYTPVATTDDARVRNRHTTGGGNGGGGNGGGGDPRSHEGGGVVVAARLPRCYPWLVLLGFSSSVVWMDLLASELVALMEACGVALGVSTALLGLTVLALGNSVGDLVSDASVARAGNAPMAIAACFGSPLLTSMLGFGIALTVSTGRTYPEPFLLPPALRPSLYAAWAALLGNLAFALVAFHCSDYAPPRALAVPFFSVYGAFVFASLVAEARTAE